MTFFIRLGPAKAAMKFAFACVALVTVAELAQAQSAGPWARCGGQGFTGSTECPQGFTCSAQNSWYSLCLPSNSGLTPSFAPTADPSTPPSSSSSPPSPPSSGGNKSAGCGKAAGIASGTYSITVNGKVRQYILRVPQNYNQDTAYKFIFALHWLGGSMTQAQAIEGGFYGLQALAKETAIFVAPDGLNRAWVNVLGEDVLLMDAIMEKIESNLCVDTTQRFSTGFSYGASMSYALACARPDKFRAVALYAGAQVSGCAGGGTKPVAFWSTHGLADTVLPYAMGRALRDHFLQVNGCEAKNAPEPVFGQPHTKTVYTCKAGYPVQFYAHTGGHVADPRDPGQFQSWAPAEVWAFFSQFS
ncbi:hypothetical protein AeMF1_019990 [Aphanomyces euteiches]|nr:hypothetical protein AeMF1_019990 [Aphanomyces euteiches]KAH9180934.1 hypothetical protein AeNC1_017091 [Aphanomyces euteiches]